MLYNLDIGKKDWYENLDSELKKHFPSYVAMRFASSTKLVKYYKKHIFQMLMSFVMKDFSTLQKHLDDSLLFWKLLCLCGVARKNLD